MLACAALLAERLLRRELRKKEVIYSRVQSLVQISEKLVAFFHDCRPMQFSVTLYAESQVADE